MNQDKEAKKRAGVVSCYQKVFSSGEGHRVLLDLLKQHYMMESTFHSNPNEMYFREGERNVVLRILHLLKIDARELYKRIEEANQTGEE